MFTGLSREDDPCFSVGDLGDSIGRPNLLEIEVLSGIVECRERCLSGEYASGKALSDCIRFKFFCLNDLGFLGSESVFLLFL